MTIVMRARHEQLSIESVMLAVTIDVINLSFGLCQLLYWLLYVIASGYPVLYILILSSVFKLIVQDAALYQEIIV